MSAPSPDAFSAAVDDARASRPVSALAARIVQGATPAPVYVLGRNRESEALCGHLKIAGLVDDFSPPGAEWRGLPVVRGDQLPAGAIVINASTSIRPVDAQARLRALPVESLPVCAVVAASGGELAAPAFVRRQQISWDGRRGEWIALYSELADEVSRQTLFDVLRYRLTADPDVMLGYRVRLADQYFEDFLELGAERFIDAGAFDGDTAEAFCRRYPDYLEVLLFEPSAINLERARARLTGMPRLRFFEEGLSDRAGVLSFDAASGSASAVSESGSEQIRVTTLDAVDCAPPSFIKMDLEGWEEAALEGCRRIVTTHRPKLAIAAYHDADHFLDIRAKVASQRRDYHLRLRHYTQGWSETVLYFS